MKNRLIVRKGKNVLVWLEFIIKTEFLPVFGHIINLVSISIYCFLLVFLQPIQNLYSFCLYNSSGVSFNQFPNWQDIKPDNLETNHFVLVHGGGFGAWCWYKTIALLEESGYKVTAVDLTGSGIHSFDTNNITSLSQYVKPLTDFIEKLAGGEKVMFPELLMQ